MKKFSRISALGVTAAAAFALAACHPPSQVDSDVKIDNASTFENQNTPAASESATEEPSAEAGASEEPAATDEAAAGAEVQFIDCVAAPVTEPTEVSLDCTTNADVVTEITWDSWDDEGAEGTGTRGEDEVTINLSEPTQTENGLAFTLIEVDGETVAP
ncbi:MAG: hypothetical protein Q4F64_03195 [Corynebacterium casei]|nr:hypothetical protein [Corynebacterium casei]